MSLLRFTCCKIILLIWLKGAQTFKIDLPHTQCLQNPPGTIGLDLEASCLQVVQHNGAELSPCWIRYFAGISIILWNFVVVEQRDTVNQDTELQRQSNCQNYLIVTDQLQFAFQRLLAGNRVRFLPYSRIFFVHTAVASSDVRPQDFRKSELQYAYEMAIFVHVLTFRMATLRAVHDVLTDVYLEVNGTQDIEQSFLDDWYKHRFIDIDDKSKMFRIGLYNCSPYVLYLDATGTKIDGVEYRIVRSVTRNWNVQFVHRDYSEKVKNPWINITSDISNHITDMGMCSIWMDAKRAQEFDLTTNYDQQCSTLLVPKPYRLNEATAIYLSFSVWVWVFFLCSAIVTGILLTYMSNVEGRIDVRYLTVFSSGSRSFLEIVSIATSHGVHVNPIRTPIKVLLNSWIILCLLVGVCYTTRYTSLLTSPTYSKPINSVSDFVELKDHRFATLIPNGDIERALRASDINSYRLLAERTEVMRNRNELLEKLKTGRYGTAAVVLSKRYLANNLEWLAPTGIIPKLRLMKNCMFNNLPVFAFKKYSPYTKLFNGYVRRFQEAGIVEKWFDDICGKHEWDYAKVLFSLDADSLAASGPKALGLYNFSGAFLVLMVGILLSTIAFVIEIAMPYIK